MIAVMSGLQDEVKMLVRNMTEIRTVPFLDHPAFMGKLEGHEIIVVGSGVGKVRASAFAQHLFDRFQVERMIIFGLAGALHAGLRIGDVVVSRQAIMYDYVVAGEGVNEDISIGALSADPSLVDLALTASKAITRDGAVCAGLILTGDSAVADADHRRVLRRDFGGDCVEMEGAAAGLVCTLNGVPFVIVRTISDLADERAHQQFESAFDDVARLSASIVQEMLRLMYHEPGPALPKHGSGTGQPELKPPPRKTTEVKRR